jgi:hypothetical protein
MRLADGTAAIRPILIGSHASLIRGIGAPALVAATISNPRVGIRAGGAADCRCPFLRPWFHERASLNEILGDYLQYFGVIYGLLLGLLAVATYQNHTMSRRPSPARHRRLPRSTGTSAPIPNRIAPT